MCWLIKHWNVATVNPGVPELKIHARFLRHSTKKRTQWKKVINGYLYDHIFDGNIFAM